MIKSKTTAMSPCLIVRNVEQTMAHYCGKLGFEATFVEPTADPFFAVMCRDEAQLLVKALKDVAPIPNVSRHPWMPWDAFVYAPDPDELAAEFREQGATLSAPLIDRHDGLRGFEVTDPDGYVMFFGRPITP